MHVAKRETSNQVPFVARSERKSKRQSVSFPGGRFMGHLGKFRSSLGILFQFPPPRRIGGSRQSLVDLVHGLRLGRDRGTRVDPKLAPAVPLSCASVLAPRWAPDMRPFQLAPE